MNLSLDAHKHTARICVAAMRAHTHTHTQKQAHTQLDRRQLKGRLTSPFLDSSWLSTDVHFSLSGGHNANVEDFSGGSFSSPLTLTLI